MASEVLDAVADSGLLPYGCNEDQCFYRAVNITCQISQKEKSSQFGDVQCFFYAQSKAESKFRRANFRWHGDAAKRLYSALIGAGCAPIDDIPGIVSVVALDFKGTGSANGNEFDSVSFTDPGQ